MSSTNTIFRAARPVFRQQAFFHAQARQAFNRTGNFRSRFGENAKRFQSTTAGPAENVSWFKRMWDSPIGLKTVHFWAPVMKWALVIAGISDFARPAEKLSLTQNAALTATGFIWTRWCLIIKPKNYLLAAVNFFLGIVGIVQVARITIHNQSTKSVPQSLEDVNVEAEKVASA